MDKHRNFTLEILSYHPLNVYLEKISFYFGKSSKVDKTLAINQKARNNDVLVLNKLILKEDLYLNIDFILGEHSEYIKLNCDVYAKKDKEIDLIESKLEEICGI